MQKKIAVQKGPVWGSHSSERPATHRFRLRKQAASVKHMQESWHELELQWNIQRKSNHFSLMMNETPHQHVIYI